MIGCGPTAGPRPPDTEYRRPLIGQLCKPPSAPPQPPFCATAKTVLPLQREQHSGCLGDSTIIHHCPAATGGHRICSTAKTVSPSLPSSPSSPGGVSGAPGLGSSSEIWLQIGPVLVEKLAHRIHRPYRITGPPHTAGPQPPTPIRMSGGPSR